MRPVWALVQLGEFILLLGFAGLLFGHADWMHPVLRAALLFGAVLGLGALNLTMSRRFMNR